MSTPAPAWSRVRRNLFRTASLFALARRRDLVPYDPALLTSSAKRKASSHRILMVLGWALVSAQITSCRRVTGPKPLARIGGRAITAADLDHQIARMPSPQREQHAGPAKRKELLDRMIRFELLAIEAERRGHASDPEILRAHKQQMIAAMVREDAPPATDSEAEAYYRGHYAEFHRPDDFRLRRSSFRPGAPTPSYSTSSSR